MICKLCLEDKPLIEAHVIPESFYRIDPRSVPRVASNIPGSHRKRSPKGIYDTTIVCQSCERLFSQPDDYAQKVLLRDIGNAAPVKINGEAVAFLLPDIDYQRMKMFFITLLWRASVSSHAFFSKIDIGPFEAILRETIRKNDPGDPEFFGVVLGKFDQDLGTAMLNPHREKFFGVNFCRFYLADYVAYIKVDKRNTPGEFRSILLAPGCSWPILTRILEGSADLRVIQDVIRRSRKRT